MSGLQVVKKNLIVIILLQLWYALWLQIFAPQFTLKKYVQCWWCDICWSLYQTCFLTYGEQNLKAKTFLQHHKKQHYKMLHYKMLFFHIFYHYQIIAVLAISILHLAILLFQSSGQLKASGLRNSLWRHSIAQITMTWKNENIHRLLFQSF